MKKIKKQTKYSKQKSKKHWLKSHRWDETMVVLVMLTSFICILILLSSYLVSTGQATFVKRDLYLTKEKAIIQMKSSQMINKPITQRTYSCEGYCVITNQNSCILGMDKDYKVIGCNTISREELNCLCR